jgi:prepilin-type N-terminal cleavage/methylation domain-containing protein
MDKNGFSLVELLAVIVMLAIILSITAPSITNIIQNTSLKSFIMNEEMMVRASKEYLSMKDNLLPSNVGDTIEIKLSLLQSEKLISSIPNPWDKDDICDGYILITKLGPNNYDYTPYLKCSSNYKANGYVEDGLAVSWKLDGNVYDYTPNNNLGVMYNSFSTVNRFGMDNKALGFNGPSNFVDTNYDYSLDYNGGTTFYLWVKFSTINTEGKVKNIFGKNSWEYLLSQVDNKIQFTQWASAGEYAIRLTSNINLEANKWYNIALVYNGLEKRAYLYVDGKLDSSNLTIASSFANNNESLKLGRGYPDIGAAASTFFTGTIDNFCIYNRALSLFEINLNYNVDKFISR